MADDGALPVGQRVLLVDDNDVFAQSLAAVLRALGCEVRIAHDARECIEQAIPFCPDTIFIDIALPGINGWELARKIKSIPLLCPSNLIALTAFAHPVHRARSLAAGFSHHLIKPVRAPELAAILSNH